MSLSHQRLNKSNVSLSVEAEGALDLLDRNTCSFLLSHQSRLAMPGNWWVNAARDVARWAASNDMVAVTGGGLLHLDFARWAAHSFGPVIYLDISDILSLRTTGAGSAPDHWCDLRLIPNLKTRMSKNELLSTRDSIVAALSDTLVAIAVRKGGIMERLGLEALAKGRRVLALEPPSPAKEYAGNHALLENGAEKLELDVRCPVFDSGIKQLKSQSAVKIKKNKASLTTADYLWHFTREFPGPWPGQTWGTYFSELAAGALDSGHSALDSLARILSEERIRACGRMIRGGYPVVCWSGAEPVELMERRRYRSALVRWEFQPYAIGLRREVAEKLGLEKVIYMASEGYSSVPERDRFRFQARSEGSSAKWSEDEEWRNMGDFLLTDLHPSEGAVLVHTQDEITGILPDSRFPVISMIG